MDINTDMYNDEPTQPRKPIEPQPTEPQIEMEATQEFLPAQPVPTTPFAQGVPTVPLQSTTTPFSPPATVSRRKFMGVSVAGSGCDRRGWRSCGHWRCCIGKIDTEWRFRRSLSWADGKQYADWAFIAPRGLWRKS